MCNACASRPFSKAGRVVQAQGQSDMCRGGQFVPAGRLLQKRRGAERAMTSCTDAAEANRKQVGLAQGADAAERQAGLRGGCKGHGRIDAHRSRGSLILLL
jgi:hypothetical protein